MKYKNSIRITGLQGVIEKRLLAIQSETIKEIIPFSLIMHRLCSSFTITRKECWDLLFYLQDQEMIKIIPFHGVKIRELILSQQSLENQQALVS